MRTFANWMIAMFMILYWGFRVVVAYQASVYNDFFVKPINLTVEIILLFVTVICIVLVFKRKIIGAIIYFLAYLAYFGIDLINQVMPVFTSGQAQITNYMGAFTSFLGIILAFTVLVDLSIDKGRKPKDKKTDWFYTNKEYDRQLDERADKNNYRTL